MKKSILCLLLAICVGLSPVQARKVYAELIGQQKGLFSNKVKITVDFGQNVSFWKQGDMTIVDNEGKDIVFNSMVDAMNFMGKCGWEFVQAYVVSEGSQSVYHWLMTKDVNSDEEIKAGFNVRADIREQDQPKYTISFLKKRKNAMQWDTVKTETRKLTQEEVGEIVENWKSQTSDTYDFDCQIRKE